MRYHYSFLTLALIALLALVAGPSSANAQNKDSAQISHLFRQADAHAVQLARDAEELDSYSNSRMSWESHANQLESMRTHINQMGKLLAEMQDMRDEASPWQQDAIDRVEPILRELADQMTITIEHGSKYPNRIHFPEYKSYTKACAELASQTSRMVADIIEYDRSQSKARRLQQKLELTSESASHSE